MEDPSAAYVTRQTFWLTVTTLILLQGLGIVLFGGRSEPQPQSQERPSEFDSIKARSMVILTPAGQEVMRLESSPIEYEDGPGPLKKGYTARFQMRRPGDIYTSIQFEVTPPGGPTMMVRHPRSQSSLIVSCIEEDTFSLSFGTSGHRGQALRIHVANRDRRLTILDSATRPFLILETDATGVEPKITIQTDLAQPVRIEKRPPPMPQPAIGS